MRGLCYLFAALHVLLLGVCLSYVRGRVVSGLNMSMASKSSTAALTSLSRNIHVAHFVLGGVLVNG